ncbi:MAG TPA: hypothetical protein O0W90_00655 [Methanocorpusculum sp.]|nr:hypothetical protein [Methanocorpusculum sp.]
MALKSLGDTLRLLVITPYVWFTGIFAALSILLVYIVYQNLGIIAAVPVGVILLFILPSLMVGTYGIILENHGSPKVYFKYVRYGYLRCLFPFLFVIIMWAVLTLLIKYIAAHFAVSIDIISISMITAIPIFFFCYFADISALINSGGIFKSIKESAVRVANGSFSVTAFYLFNISAFILMSIVFSIILSMFVIGSTDILTSFTESEILSMSQAELYSFAEASMNDFFLTPEGLTSRIISLSICALFFFPFFVTYKACYFKRLITSAPINRQPNAAEADGEYDEKGRWFKYK